MPGHDSQVLRGSPRYTTSGGKGMYGRQEESRLSLTHNLGVG